MSRHNFRIFICGAGIAGLSAGIGLARAGHQVTILESAHQLSPVGGGIHIPPNATLVLKRWDILERFQSIAIVPEGFTFRRYADSSILGQTQSATEQQGNTPSTPYWTVKRSDYQRVLFEIAQEAGVDVRLGCRVLEVDQQKPAVKLEDGTSLEADLVVVADGIKSKLRQQLLPDHQVSPILQPYETYRAWAPADVFVANPAVHSLLQKPTANVWIGQNRHIIIYPADNGRILAINGTHAADNNSAAEWNKPASVAGIQHSFRMFDPVVRDILGEARDCKAWALAEVPRLARWTSESGRVVMLGDAAHAMLQFLAQGAAMAVEDAAALAECVERLASPAGIPEAMRVFERSRRWRCEKVQSQARRNGEFIHMYDGEEQEHRDRKLAGLATGSDQEVDTGPFFDVEFQSWLYGHDVFEHTRELLDAANL